MSLITHRSNAFLAFFPLVLLVGLAPSAAQTISDQAKLIASDAADLDLSGSSVSLSGNTAVFGSPSDRATPFGQGAAYVFVSSGSTWTQQAKLVASDAAGEDRLGSSVAISGDTAVVGAPGVNINPLGTGDEGAAYVFVRSGTTWTQQAKLVANDATDGDLLGSSVSIAGDTIVVGARSTLATPNGQGAAYVFVRSGTVWTQQAKLVASDAAGEDHLGSSVSISGDTVIVGAPHVDLNPLGAGGEGAAYVFVRSGTTWTQQAKLVASDAADGDSLGSSASISGDTVVVGAPQANVNPLGFGNEGAGYVFVRSGTTWTQQAKLVASDAADDDSLGSSVSISGGTVAVGAPHANLNPLGLGDEGAGYAFARSGTVWTQSAKLIASDAADDDLLGSSVSLSGSTAILGAPGVDLAPALDNEGAAYAFCVSTASASFRNAGSNPASYTCSAPVLGASWSGTVDLSTSGHSSAYLYAFSTQSSLVQPQGQVLLGNGRIARVGPVAGPLALFSFAVPSSLSLCGFHLTTLALHVGAVSPFALSNAMDLVVGP